MVTIPIYKTIGDDELADGLKKATDNVNLVTEFWRSLTRYPVSLINSGSYSQARGLLLYLLHRCKNIDLVSYSEIHKGNPFYFLGIASYLMHDYQTATFFFDSAVSEDLRYGADAIKNPKPSTRFLALEGSEDDQAAKQLTQFAESKVQRSLNIYNLLYAQHPDLTIVNLREKFLFPALSPNSPPGWRTLATVFVSFFLEWDFRNELIELQPYQGTSEPFYIHLFKGCVLFESLLKENPSKNCTAKTLGKALGNLYKELGLESPPKISSTFKEILDDVLHIDNSIETAINFTGKVRNTTGHRLSWNEHISKLAYQQLFEMIAVSCLHAIAVLY